MRDSFAHTISASTQYCAVYGHPVRHSASPAMQNAGIAALGLNWRYLAFDVRPDQLRSALEGARSMRFIGINLTVPHKILAMDMVDELDESARSFGAVNTVRMEGRAGDGTWRPMPEFPEPPTEVRMRGFNTDAEAIERALREDLGVELNGARVLLLGAGGAGRTAALKMAASGVRVLFLLNRTASRAEELADELRRRHPATKVAIGYPEGEVDVLVNSTSLGLASADPLPFNPEKFAINRAAAVYDMIYRPAQTRLLEEANKAGCRAANGMSMLLYQGAKALQLWTGQPAPEKAMREALENELKMSGRS